MLSIVIVTRNTRGLLESLLLSVEADNSLKPVINDIVVVDNGSDDGTGAMLAARFPAVSCIRNEENRGFAAAVNEGIRRSSGRFVLFLNSDTRLIPGEMRRMLAFMEHEPNAGITGPQLIYEDGRPQRSFALEPSLALELLPRPLLELLLPGRFRTKGAGLSAPHDVHSLIGAAIMVRRELLDELEGFDERFFFFLEETDLCIRAGRRSYRVVFFPGARLIHLQGQTVSRSWVKGRIEYAISLYKFLGKHHSRPYAAAFRCVRLCKTLLFLAAVSLVPVLLIKDSMRRKYRYYAELLVWHLHGCPDDAGLRASSRG